MKRKLLFGILVFWWAIMFPVLNFPEANFTQSPSESIQVKSFLMELLQSK